jgi:hypothetical protein
MKSSSRLNSGVDSNQTLLVVNKEDSNVIDGEDKAKIIQDVLLRMYLQQFES